jgi:DNA-binding transcriptional MerR regulator
MLSWRRPHAVQHEETCMADTPLMRIGELARRTGMAEATLRAWERRYGIPKPKRTVGGHRLYSEQDVVRLSRIQRLVEQGWAVGSAARRVGRELGPGVARAPVPAPADEVATALAERLVRAFERFDATQAHATLDEALASGPLSVVLDEIVRPALDRFARAQEPVKRAQCRFGAALLHTRMASLLADMTGAAGDVAVAGAAEGEAHDFSTVVHAIPLAEAGWTVRLLGPDVSVADLAAAATVTGAKVALVTALEREHAEAFLRSLEMPPGVTVAVGGSGFRDLELPEGVVRADEPVDSLVAALRAELAPLAR